MAYAYPLAKLDKAQKEFIRSMLFFQPETTFFQKTYGRKEDMTNPVLFYHIEDETIYLPYLFSASMFKICPNIDKKFPKTSIEFCSQLRPYQEPVVKQAFEHLDKIGTTTLALYPGFGKTILGVKLAAKYKLLTCILITREILSVQWAKTCKDHLKVSSISSDGVLTVSDPSIWIVGFNNPPSFDIIICMNTRVEKIPKTILDMVGFLIIDEAHMFCTPSNVKPLLSFTPMYIVSETATPERDDDMHKMMQSIVGTHCIVRENNKPFSVIKVNTNIKPIRTLNRFGTTDYTKLVGATLFDVRRNIMITEMVVRNLHKTVLVLTSQVEHVNILHTALKNNNINCEFMCGTKSDYVDSNVLIGTTSKIGTGFDQSTSAINYRGQPFNLIILVCSIKKYAQLTQNIGRGFRCDNLTVMHFVDNDDIYDRHWKKAKKWYETRGGTITEFTFPEDYRR